MTDKDRAKASVNIEELTDAYIEVAKRGDVRMSYVCHRISELEQEFKVKMCQRRIR